MSRSGEGGTVTAETALVLPLVSAFCLMLMWLVSVGIAQVQVIDAARDAARSAARGDSADVATAIAKRTAPDDAAVAVDADDATTTVTVSARVVPPRWLLIPLPTITVSADATVDTEDSTDQGSDDALP